MSNLPDHKLRSIANWRAKNPDKVKAIFKKAHKKYYDKHQEARVGKSRTWRDNNPDKVREINKRWIANNKERYDEYRKKYKEENKERFKKYEKDKVLRKIARQNVMATRPRPDRCELCGEIGPVVYDHCHKTGIFRGWLCSKCNRFLGWLEHDLEMPSKVTAYLDNFNNSNEYKEAVKSG